MRGGNFEAGMNRIQPQFRTNMREHMSVGCNLQPIKLFWGQGSICYLSITVLFSIFVIHSKNRNSGVFYEIRPTLPKYKYRALFSALLHPLYSTLFSTATVMSRFIASFIENSTVSSYYWKKKIDMNRRFCHSSASQDNEYCRTRLEMSRNTLEIHWSSLVSDGTFACSPWL